QTPWNVERRIQGWRDIELNDNGRAQADALAIHLSNQHTSQRQTIDAVYSSDLLRAQQTAQAVAHALALPLTLIEGVRERNYGVLEGIEFDRMQEHAPEVAKVWAERHPDGVIPDGETLRQFHQRVTESLHKVAAQHPGERVVVVTHGGAMDIIWRQAMGIDLQAPRKALLLNASVNRISLTPAPPTFLWSLVQWGNVDHLTNSDNDLGH
ncbi:MAG: histidine phosphatase family protein, partial [Orrella sp.]